MTTLMTYVGPVDARSLVTRTGGMPLTPVGFSWPRCAECAGPMQFLAQLLLTDLGSPAHDRGVLSIFMCQNDPGMCDEWDPVSGGNRALLFPHDELTPAAVPAEGEALLPEVCGIAYAAINTDSANKDVRPGFGGLARPSVRLFRAPSRTPRTVAAVRLRGTSYPAASPASFSWTLR